MIIRLRSGSSTPASRSRKRSRASTWISLMPRPSRNVSTTCSASPLRSRPWSTSTQVSWSPIASWTSAAAVAESTPPERPQMTPPEPTCVADPLDLLVDHRGGRPVLLAARDLAEEALEDRLPVRRVDDLGVELDAVERRARRPRRRRPASPGSRRARRSRAAPRRRSRGGSSSTAGSRAGPASSRPPSSTSESSVRPNSPCSAPSTLPPSAWTITCMP